MPLPATRPPVPTAGLLPWLRPPPSRTGPRRRRSRSLSRQSRRTGQE
jgi:hypothetical protein